MEWQPIETAPKDGTEFLAYDGNYEIVAWETYTKRVGPNEFAPNEGFYITGTVDRLRHITHWQPLPPPPQD